MVVKLLQPDENNQVDLPDHLKKLFHKLGTQLRFHTISGKNEFLTIIHMCQIAEEYFKELLACNKPQSENGKLPMPHISERVVIMLYDCSREGIKNRIDKYDVVDCNTGIILFTGTSEECKSKYPNYIKPHFR